MRQTDSREIGGRVIQLPMVDVHTVGAGGGSIGWRDPGGALRVGPRSAGAEPGPACYGRGGDRADGDRRQPAARLPRRSTRLAGGVALDGEAAERAVGALARELEIEPLEAAEGIVRVANQEMVRALRVVTVERGIDPRGFALHAVRRRRPDARGRDRRGAGNRAAPLPAGQRRALGARAAGLRAPPRHRAHRDAARRRAHRASGSPPSWRRCARRSSRGCATRAPRSVYELRYRGQAFELPSSCRSAPASSPTRTSSPSASPPSTSAATATATPTPRSSSSTCAWR